VVDIFKVVVVGLVPLVFAKVGIAVVSVVRQTGLFWRLNVEGWRLARTGWVGGMVWRYRKRRRMLVGRCCRVWGYRFGEWRWHDVVGVVGLSKHHVWWCWRRLDAVCVVKLTR
jgi:hypothetical protein